MRFHQSWYRKYVLGLSPGPNPSAHGELYGNMLCEKDGNAGWNFITAEVHKYAEGRVASDPTHIEEKRLRNNLLSSQPMCFNLFAPLDLDRKLATRLIRALPGFGHVARVTDVKLEYAPSPKEDFLNDGTSFDAWVEYERRSDGALGFVAIETKLTEPFSQTHRDFSERYHRWKLDPAWWWSAGAEAHFSNNLYNQLWRNHLLAFALCHQKTRKYVECFCAVVSHPQDVSCLKAVADYGEHLLSEGKKTLLPWSLDTLVNTWLPLATTREESSWLQAFRLRYLDLEASEPAWQQQPATEGFRA
jgi:hypothetical protein